MASDTIHEDGPIDYDTSSVDESMASDIHDVGGPKASDTLNADR
jgi:hypothetical protein